MKFPGRAAAFAAALAAAAILVFFFFSSKGGNVRVSLSVRPRGALVGDTITYRLTVRRAVDAELEIPEFKGIFEGFDIRGSSFSGDTGVGRGDVVVEYLLARFEPGAREIPGYDIRFRRRSLDKWENAAVPGAKVRIRPLLRVDLLAEQRIEMAGMAAGAVRGRKERAPGAPRDMSVDAPIRFRIKDIGGPRKVMTWLDLAFYAFIFAAGGAVLVFIALFGFAVADYRRERRAPTLEQVAVRRLRELRDRGLLKKGGADDFCSGLSSILTDYARARFKMGMRAMTAAEFQREIDKLSDLTGEQKEFIKGRVRLCDLVRYSGYTPGAGELDPKLAKEIGFIRGMGRAEKSEENKP